MSSGAMQTSEFFLYVVRNAEEVLKLSSFKIEAPLCVDRSMSHVPRRGHWQRSLGEMAAIDNFDLHFCATCLGQKRLVTTVATGVQLRQHCLALSSA